jgi:hypothetical protein
MSLAYSASPWISENSNSNGQTQKRVPTMRKTLKKLQPTPQPEFMAKPVQDVEIDQDSNEPGSVAVASQIPTMSPSAYMSNEEVYKSASGGPSAMMSAALQDQESRQQKIQDIINKMGSVQVENDGGNLAEFKPLDHPLVEPPKMPPQVQQLYRATQSPQAPVQPSYSNVSTASLGGVDRTAAYHTAYEVPTQVASWSRGASGAQGTPMGGAAAGTTDTRLLDKINYMIHLLEQQQNDKTGHALEEFVMFSMVGVFIIYVLDSFSRTAKYTR